MGFRLVTGPASLPVSQAEAKAQCRVDGTDEDNLIDGLIAAATDYVELYLGRAIIEQTWELTADKWMADYVLKGPVQSITSVKYNDADGAEQTVSSDDYVLDDTTDRLVMKSDFTRPETEGEVNDITIRFVAGYATVPTAIKQAILLLISLWFDNREAASDRPMTVLPHAVDALLANYRAFSTE